MRADSDLGELPVTVAIGAALARGREPAYAWQRQALIFAAYPALQDEVRALLPPSLHLEPASRYSAD